MAKYRGTMRWSDLEGGLWQLVAEDGTTYEIDGGDKAIRRDGARVEIDGAVDRQAVSFTMTGPRLKVRSARLLD